MANYVENTVYLNDATGLYYYKAFTPTFMQGPTLPDYVNWTTVEANRKYTNTDTFAANTFYHYEYEDMYKIINSGEEGRQFISAFVEIK